jgi:hypothetical protein
MAQKTKSKYVPTKSRAWIEAECLKLARRCLGGSSEIQVPLNQTTVSKGLQSNWKVADITPQPSPPVSGEIRDRLARWTGKYVLED